MAIKIASGLPTVDAPRYHFDIYAIIEAPQELYFGHETQVNVNQVEMVQIPVSADEGDALDKCYISPTKRRGVERRSLIWAPVQDEGVLLGESLGCGIPHTCAQPDCPICAVYGGLVTSNTEVEVMGVKQKRTATTMLGRLVHGGGVAIQTMGPSEKQRAMHPATIHRDSKDDTPTPFRREYNQPALLYPIYNHCLSVTDIEFASVAYAFLDSLARLGAGNPKGVRLYEAELQSRQQPLLVVDRYLTPLGKRPVISPRITDVTEALTGFIDAAYHVHGDRVDKDNITRMRGEREVFQRWIGDVAMRKLQDDSLTFATTYLLG